MSPVFFPWIYCWSSLSFCRWQSVLLIVQPRHLLPVKVYLCLFQRHCYCCFPDYIILSGQGNRIYQSVFLSVCLCSCLSLCTTCLRLFPRLVCWGFVWVLLFYWGWSSFPSDRQVILLWSGSISLADGGQRMSLPLKTLLKQNPGSSGLMFIAWATSAINTFCATWEWSQLIKVEIMTALPPAWNI